MQLSTQIHRFIVSGAMLALFGIAVALLPTIEDAIGDETLVSELPAEEQPVVIIVEKGPNTSQPGPWRHMLPASLAPRRG